MSVKVLHPICMECPNEHCKYGEENDPCVEWWDKTTDDKPTPLWDSIPDELKSQALHILMPMKYGPLKCDLGGLLKTLLLRIASTEKAKAADED